MRKKLLILSGVLIFFGSTIPSVATPNISEDEENSSLIHTGSPVGIDSDKTYRPQAKTFTATHTDDTGKNFNTRKALFTIALIFSVAGIYLWIDQLFRSIKGHDDHNSRQLENKQTEHFNTLMGELRIMKQLLQTCLNQTHN